MKRLSRRFVATLFGSCFLALVAIGIPPAALAKGPALNIVMILWRGETPAEKGLVRELEKLGYTVNVTVHDADKDKKRLTDILRKDVLPNLTKFDYVYTFGTTVTTRTHAALPKDQRHIFNIVTDPVKSKIVDSVERPGRNVTGVSNKVFLPLQIENASKVLPLKKLGILFNPQEKNSIFYVKELKAIGQARGFEVVEIRTPPKREKLQEVVRSIADKAFDVDAVYLPGDSFLISNADAIGKPLTEGGVPTIAANSKYIAQGALLGTVPDYAGLGHLLARIVDRNRKGEPLAAIAIAMPTSEITTLRVGKRAAEALGISVSGTVKNVEFVE